MSDDTPMTDTHPTVTTDDLVTDNTTRDLFNSGVAAHGSGMTVYRAVEVLRAGWDYSAELAAKSS